MNVIKSKIPNIITTFRLILAFVFPIAFLHNAIDISIIIFAIASISDSLDGFLARKWNVVSEYGKRVDPIADKTLAIIALILLVETKHFFLLITLILEAIIAFLNFKSFVKAKDYSVTRWGKIKTPILFATILIGLISVLNGGLDNVLYLLCILTTVLQLFTIYSYINNQRYL